MKTAGDDRDPDLVARCESAQHGEEANRWPQAAPRLRASSRSPSLKPDRPRCPGGVGPDASARRRRAGASGPRACSAPPRARSLIAASSSSRALEAGERLGQLLPRGRRALSRSSIPAAPLDRLEPGGPLVERLPPARELGLRARGRRLAAGEIRSGAAQPPLGLGERPGLRLEPLLLGPEVGHAREVDRLRRRLLARGELGLAPARARPRARPSSASPAPQLVAPRSSAGALAVAREACSRASSSAARAASRSTLCRSAATSPSILLLELRLPGGQLARRGTASSSARSTSCRLAARVASSPASRVASAAARSVASATDRSRSSSARSRACERRLAGGERLAASARRLAGGRGRARACRGEAVRPRPCARAAGARTPARARGFAARSAASRSTSCMPRDLAGGGGLDAVALGGEIALELLQALPLGLERLDRRPGVRVRPRPR